MRLQRLDLHGYTVADAMLRFVRMYNGLVGAGAGGEVRGIEVVHGKGKGDTPSLIRDALRDYLRSNGKRISGYDTQLVLRGADYLLDKYPGDLAYMPGKMPCTMAVARL